MTRLVALLAFVSLAACGRPPIDVAEGASFETKGAGGTGAGGMTPGAADGMETGGGSASSTGTGTVAAGVLTSGMWDDNDNFDRFTAYRDALVATAARPPWTAAEQQAAHVASGVRTAKDALDIVLVIDTTGSMGDEISYLQTEFQNISQTIHDRFPTTRQRWALVAYKDYNDPYIVRGADFGTSVTWFQGELGQLSASGGGDYPEVPDQGLAQAARLTWDPAPSTARLVFWVADAPHHDDKATDMANAVRSLRDEGVHVYPVASSGVDELVEYTMRATAQLTLGRYAFLTDDSGVGGTHKEPSIPCFAVTHLNQAMVRAVDIELSGVYHPADPTTVVRSVGSPTGGVCTLADGSTATLF